MRHQMVVYEFNDKKYLIVIGGISKYTETALRHKDQYPYKEFEIPELVFGIEIPENVQENDKGQILKQHTQSMRIGMK